MTVRVVIVDDHDVIRVGVRESLADDIDVVGEGRDVESAIIAIKEFAPDVVILDVHLPGGTGGGALDVLAEILGGASAPKVLALVGFRCGRRRGGRGARGRPRLRHQVHLGARLSDAVRRVASGDAVFSPRLAGFVLDAFNAAGGEVAQADEDLDSLTEREQEVMRLIARGYTYREVGEKLFISIKTVETHVGKVLHKLQLSNRHELARWAAQRRIV